MFRSFPFYKNLAKYANFVVCYTMKFVASCTKKLLNVTQVLVCFRSFRFRQIVTGKIVLFRSLHLVGNAMLLRQRGEPLRDDFDFNRWGKKLQLQFYAMGFF